MIIIKYKKNGKFKNLPPYYSAPSIEEVLNSYGSFSFSFPVADPHSKNLKDKTEIEIWDDDNFITGGKIQQITASYNNNQEVYTFECDNYLQEFADETTLPNILYVNEYYTDILNPNNPKTLIRPNNWISVVTGGNSSRITNVQTTVVVPPNPWDKGIAFTVQSASGFPEAPFMAVAKPAGMDANTHNVELLMVTRKTGNVFYVERAQGNTEALDIQTGFEVYVAPTNTFTYLSSLQSSLNTFQIVKRQSGYNFRYIGDSENSRKIEFGYFGEFNGINVVKEIDQKHLNETNNGKLPDDTLLIADNGLVLTQISRDIVNYIYVLGGGGSTNGMNQLTLRDVDPSVIDPEYPVLIDPEIPNTDATYDPIIYDKYKAAPNTYQAYYLKNQKSIDEYGVIKRPVTFKDIYPLAEGQDEYTDEDRVRGANELYKAAVQYLEENKDNQISYQVKAFGNARKLKVGDKIKLKYKGIINQLDKYSQAKQVYADINEEFYIVSYRATLHNGYTEYDLSVSNKPKDIKDDAEILASIVESINNSDRQKQGSVSTYSVFYEEDFGYTIPANFLFWIPKTTIYTDYIHLKVRIKPFIGYDPVSDARTFDTTPPLNAKIWIDGIDYSSQLGLYNEFGDYPSAINEEFDLLKAAAELGQLDDLLKPGMHTIEVRCDSRVSPPSRGRAQLLFTNQFFLGSR